MMVSHRKHPIPKFEWYHQRKKIEDELNNIETWASQQSYPQQGKNKKMIFRTDTLTQVSLNTEGIDRTSSM